ncbi:hypothetical protein LB504_010813 [Fusarium proliferatum]|nr:hypothetical protein LB504_010813 [Fusarium proliferatum]
MDSSLSASDVQCEADTVTKNSQRKMNPHVPGGMIHTPLMRGILPFINGGISGMIATTVIQPIDMVKVRLQLIDSSQAGVSKPTTLSVARTILAQGRILDFYAGLSAGLFRQGIYTTSRLGFFDMFIKYLQQNRQEQKTAITFSERCGAGLIAGGLGAFLANRADLALVRMQSDGLLPATQRSDYKRKALWAGATPTNARAMSLNLGQLTFFSEAKARLKTQTQWPASTQTLAASAIAGFLSAVVGIPFDFVKTRLQRQKPGPDGRLVYNSMVDCFRKVAVEEGWTRFYRGFGTLYFRIAPHAMITLVTADYLGWITSQYHNNDLRVETLVIT